MIEALKPAVVRATSMRFSPAKVSNQSRTSDSRIWVLLAIWSSVTKPAVFFGRSRIACKTIHWAPKSLAMTSSGSEPGPKEEHGTHPSTVQSSLWTSSCQVIRLLRSATIRRSASGRLARSSARTSSVAAGRCPSILSM